MSAIKRWTFRLLVCIAAAELLIGGAFSRVRLGERYEEREKFQEMLYVPGGAALDLASSGFKAPLADYWWIKGLLYFSDNFRSMRRVREARFKYLYQLFNVVTDLSPKFWRGYIVGSQFLSSGRNADLLAQAVELLEKGRERQEKDTAEGRPWAPDSRWRFHFQLAYLYDTQIQALAVAKKDRVEARRAREKALEEYGKAAVLPGCDPLVIAAYEGLRDASVEDANLSRRLELSMASVERLAKDLGRDKRKSLAGQYERDWIMLHARKNAIEGTEHLEHVLTDEMKKMDEKIGKQVVDIWHSLNRRDVMHDDPLDGNPLYGAQGDDFIRLPGGRVRSVQLAVLEEAALRLVIEDRVTDYYVIYDKAPESVEKLVEEGLLQKVPVHPLGQLGTKFVIDSENGNVFTAQPYYLNPMPRPVEIRPMPPMRRFE